MTTEDFIKDNPQYFEDELDKWLYREFDILGGAQSSIESMKYHVAREVAEKAMEYAKQQPLSDDLEEADDRLVTLRPDIDSMVERFKEGIILSRNLKHDDLMVRAIVYRKGLEDMYEKLKGELV